MDEKLSVTDIIKALANGVKLDDIRSVIALVNESNEPKEEPKDEPKEEPKDKPKEEPKKEPKEEPFDYKKGYEDIKKQLEELQQMNRKTSNQPPTEQTKNDLDVFKDIFR